MSIHCTDCQKLYRTHKAHDAVHRSRLAAKDAEIARLKKQLDCIGEYGTEEINAAVELRQSIVGVANMMRGMTMDPAIPEHAKSAMCSKINELEALIEGN